MAARDATMHRLRLLQAACAPLGSPGAQPEAWLFVCGVDGKDNWGSAAALRWLLLGESGRGLLEERVRPFFVGNDVPLASDADREAVAEALEETVLLVTRTTVSVLYDARAAPALATLLVCPGLREYVVDGANGDVDAAEAAKAAGFVRLVACEVGAAGARVGVVLPRGAESAPVWKSNLQPDFNVRVCDRFDARFSDVLRELDESNRSVQKSAESTSI